jgi:hypothetical protein
VLCFRHDHDRLRELADWHQEERGPVTEDEHVTTFEELENLDAERECRRSAGEPQAGEAA